MSATADQALLVLQSIDATLKTMLAVMQQREAKVRASQPKAVASDRDLDGKWGDPVLRFLPRDWTGDQRFKGYRFSECPAELLEMAAETLDYFAGKAEASGELTPKGKPVAEFKRADAARARGWSKRISEGKHTPSAVLSGGQSGTPDGQDPWADDVPEWEEEHA